MTLTSPRRSVLLAVLIALSASVPARAAEEEPARPRSLLDLKFRHKAVEAGGQARFTRIDRTNALLSGGFVEVIFNQIVGVGFQHLALATEVQPDDALEPVELSQTGLVFTILESDETHHGRFALGIASLAVEGKTLDGDFVKARGTAFEPELAYECNLFPYVRFGFGMSYRMAILPGSSLLTSRKVSSLTGLVTLYAGIF